MSKATNIKTAKRSQLKTVELPLSPSEWMKFNYYLKNNGKVYIYKNEVLDPSEVSVFEGGKR